MEYPLVTKQPGIENSLAEKDLGGLFNLSDSVSQQCVLAAKASCTLGCSSRSVAKRSGQVIHPLCWKLLRMHLECPIQFWASHNKKAISMLEQVLCRASRKAGGWRAPRVWKEDERTRGFSHKRRIRRAQSSDYN